MISKKMTVNFDNLPFNDQSYEFIEIPTQDEPLVMTGWNCGIGLYRKVDDGWQEVISDPGFIVFSAVDSEYKETLTCHFFSNIPVSIADKVSTLQYRQFSVLKLISLEKRLFDVFFHSPTLFWMAVIEMDRQNLGHRQAIRLLQSNRFRIVETLFNKNTSKGAVRFISKLSLDKYDQFEFKLIKDCLQNTDVIEHFRHFQHISIRLLTLVRRYPLLLKTSLLKRLLNDEQDTSFEINRIKWILNLLIDTKRMSEEMGEELPDEFYHRIKTEEQVNRSHDRVVMRYNWLKKKHKYELVMFPVCPLGDNEDFIQIKNNRELQEEGEAIHHCVGSCAIHASKGFCFFYKVLMPERATLEFEIKRNYTRIVECKLACNDEPSEKIIEHIRSFLKG
jgi:hypothetical protein